MSEKRRMIPRHRHLPSDIVETPDDMLLKEWRSKEDLSKVQLDSLKSIPDDYFPASTEGRAKFQDEFVNMPKVSAEAISSIVKQAETESLVPNNIFEEDKNNDGVPDLWTAEITGTGSVTLITSDQVKGGKCARFSVGATNDKALLVSEYVPIESSKKYYVSAFLKTDLADNSDLYFIVRWFSAAKTLLSSTTIKDGSATTVDWTKYSTEITSPATAKYAKIVVGLDTPATPFFYVYADNVIFSEQRTALPTSGIIAASTTGYTSTDECTNLIWETTGSTFNIPDVDHELYFVSVACHLMETLVGHSAVGVRIKLTKTGETTEYYPTTGYGNVPLIIFPLGDQRAGNVFITIPKNRKGWTVTIELYFDYAVSGDYTIKTFAVGWGHSQHAHQ